jgi:hypothetical protein
MLGTAWKRWNWLEEGLIPLAAALMHAAWAFPLFALFVRDPLTGTRSPGFTFWLCLAVLLGGVLAGRMASQNRMGLVIVVVGGLAVIWISLLLTIPAEAESLDAWVADVLDRVTHGREGEPVPVPFVVGLCVALLWWRGIRIASADHGETVGAFVAGVIALAGLLVLALILAPAPSRELRTASSALGPLVFLVALMAALAFAVLGRFIGERSPILSQLAVTIGLLFLASILPAGPSAEALGGWILLFLASGLTTLALNGVLHTLREQAEKTGVRLRVDRYWAMTALGVVAVVLLVGLIIGQLIAPGTVVRAFGWIKPIWTALVRLLLLIIFIFAYLFFSLFEPLLAGLENRPERALPRAFESPLRPEDVEDLAREPIQIPPIFGQILQAILILGAVALVAWIFYRAARGRKRAAPMQNDIVETRETILSLDLVRSQLRGLLDGLRRRGAPPLFLEVGPPDDPRRTIRELYQRVLARAIALDLPRARGQTPSAYQRTLLYLCAEERASLETLTLAYEAARYGIATPTLEQVQAAQEAFARIDAALQARVRTAGS